MPSLKPVQEKQQVMYYPYFSYFKRKKELEKQAHSSFSVGSDRELAIQVSEVFQTFNAYLNHKIRVRAVFGGVSINPQMMQMQGTEIVVATPGRLLDLLSSRALHLTSLEVLVLDEADKMLNLGFKDEIAEIFKLLPAKKAKFAFSATEGADLNAIKNRILFNPVKITIQPEEQNIDLIAQTAYQVTSEKKGVFLRYLIKQRDIKQVLVFVSSTHRADHVVDKLIKNGINAGALHSKKSQEPVQKC